MALDVESLVDVLTLKDNAGVSAGDPAVALDRLVKDDVSFGYMRWAWADLIRQGLPEGRKQVALLSIWRRIYIRDE